MSIAVESWLLNRASKSACLLALECFEPLVGFPKAQLGRNAYTWWEQKIMLDGPNLHRSLIHKVPNPN